MPPFPAKVIYEIIPSQNLCAEYRVVKEKPLQVEWVKDMTIAECPRSIFGFEAGDASEVMDWIRAVQFNRGKR